MEFDLKRILKALLLSTGDPIDAKAVLKLFARYHERRAAAAEPEADLLTEQDDADAPEPGGDGPEAGGGEAAEAESAGPGSAVPTLVTRAQIREAFEELQREAEATDEAYRIVETPEGYRIATAPEFAEWVRLLRGDPRPLKLSPAALEVLAIVAYRQPVTRAEIERVRGVSSDSALNRLIELELAHVTGRADLPGRPIQYGSTSRFLELAGITGLDALPASDVLTPERLDAFLRAEEEPEDALSDQDVGLPRERPAGELPLDEEFAAIELDGKEGE